MNIGCFVQFDEPFQPVAAITMPVLSEYCARHDYELEIAVNPPVKRTIVWDRVQVLLANLERFDWLVHFDADVLITNLNIPLTEFLTTEAIVLCTTLNEKGEVHFNDGVSFYRNCETTKLLLDKAWAMYGQPDILCGQDALEWLHGHDPTARRHFSIEKQKRINSFLFEEYKMPKETKGNWTVGDFALHLPGCSTQRRVEIFTNTEVIR